MKYREDFLTKSRFGISLLERINKIISRLPGSPVLVVDFDIITKKIVRYRIAKKWW